MEREISQLKKSGVTFVKQFGEQMERMDKLPSQAAYEAGVKSNKGEAK
jgi:hypothetical protein